MVYTKLWYTQAMERAVLTKANRSNFFKKLLSTPSVDFNILATRYSMSPRTLRDWHRGKFLPNVDVLRKIAKDYDLTLPPFKTRRQYWYAIKSSVKAARKRLELYGPPGTPEGRRKGGLVSQQKRRENPEYYRSLGCKMPKIFPTLQQSKELAELFGIILGDGSITDNQLRISLDRVVDRNYSFFVEKLISKVLGETPARFIRESTIELYISGVNLIKQLDNLGLKRGSKVAHQVEVPKWIMNSKKYSFACLRGLFDTDGGLYIHRHRNYKNTWNNLGWCFTNHSVPLVQACRSILLSAKIQPRGDERRVYLYAVGNIRKFLEVIGSSNQKNIDLYNLYMKEYYRYEWKRRGAGVV